MIRTVSIPMSKVRYDTFMCLDCGACWFGWLWKIQKQRTHRICMSGSGMIWTNDKNVIGEKRWASRRAWWALNIKPSTILTQKLKLIGRSSNFIFNLVNTSRSIRLGTIFTYELPNTHSAVRETPPQASFVDRWSSLFNARKGKKY